MSHLFKNPKKVNQGVTHSEYLAPCHRAEYPRASSAKLVWLWRGEKLHMTNSHAADTLFGLFLQICVFNKSWKKKRENEKAIY